MAGVFGIVTFWAWPLCDTGVVIATASRNPSRVQSLRGYELSCEPATVTRSYSEVCLFSL
jgi:hypothetical protein